MNAVRTHIEHFIGSNPLLASTSCTDPVNNLKNPPIQISRNIIKTPQIVLNLTENDGKQTRIRSRSPSPFWIKGETCTYSEVVKTGCVSSRNNSRSATPEPKLDDVKGGTRRSRKSGFNNLLQTPPSTRARSKSPKDRWQPKYLEKITTLHVLPPQEPSSSARDGRSKEDDSPPSPVHIKRRSRSRRNRKATDKDSGIKPVSGSGFPTNAEKTVSPDSHAADTYTSSPSTGKPEIVVSDVKTRRNSEENLQSHSLASLSPPATRGGNRNSLTVGDTMPVVPSNAVSAVGENTMSKFRLSLDDVFGGTGCSDSCFDLNERLKGIFGSVDQKHYRNNRAVDRPRSKSDTRDLNELTQIFTSPNTDDNNKSYTCRFERSAGSVKNHSNRDSTSGRRSFDTIITISSPFGNTQIQRRSGGTTDNEHHESVRLPNQVLTFVPILKPFSFRLNLNFLIYLCDSLINICITNCLPIFFFLIKQKHLWHLD